MSSKRDHYLRAFHEMPPCGHVDSKTVPSWAQIEFDDGGFKVVDRSSFFCSLCVADLLDAAAEEAAEPHDECARIDLEEREIVGARENESTHDAIVRCAAERERLKEIVITHGRSHADKGSGPCPVGTHCPWCESEYLRKSRTEALNSLHQAETALRDVSDIRCIGGAGSCPGCDAREIARRYFSMNGC